MATNKELVAQAIAAIPLWRAFLDQKEAEQDALLAEVRNEEPPSSKPKQLLKSLTARFSRKTDISQKGASDATQKFKAPHEAPAPPSEAENTAQGINPPKPEKGPETGHTAFAVQAPVSEPEKVTQADVPERHPPVSEPEKVAQALPEIEPKTPHEADFASKFGTHEDFDDDEDDDQFQDLFS